MKNIAEHIKIACLISKASISNKWGLYLYISNRFNLNVYGIIILKNFINLLLVSLVLYIGSNRMGEDYKFIVIVFSYLLMMIQVFSPIFYTEQQIFGRNNFFYWSTQSCDKEKYSILLLDAITIESLLKNLGILVPLLGFLVMKNGIGSIFLFILLVLLCQIIHFVKYFKSNKKLKLVKVIAYFLTSFCLSGIVYLLFNGIYILINYTRVSTFKYGFTNNFVQKTNDEINDKLKYLFYGLRSYISGKYTNNNLMLLILMIVLLFMIIILVRKQVIEPIVGKKNTSRYMEMIYNLFSNRYSYMNKINLNLGRKLDPLWNHCSLNIILLLETWMFVIINYVTSKYVYNVWAISILFFFEMYFICIASYRNIMGHYREIYEFGLEIKSIYLFRCLDSNRLDILFFEKLRSLFLTAIPVIFLNQLVILLSYMLFFEKIGIVYFNLLLLLPLVFTIGIWSLRPIYDKFKYIVNSNYIINFDSENLDLREILGGDVIGKSIKLPMQVAIYFLTIIILIGSSFGLVTDLYWLYIYIGSLCIIAILLFINSITSILQIANINKNIFIMISRTKIFIAITFFEVAVFFVGVVNNLKEIYSINPTNLEFLPLFKHNLFIMLIVVVLGLVTFGLGGVIFGSITVYKLGAIFYSIIMKYGWSPIITGVLPHALFELTAILLAMLIGFEPCRQLLMYQINHRQNWHLEIKTITTLAIISIILLFIAAIIESRISYV